MAGGGGGALGVGALDYTVIRVRDMAAMRASMGRDEVSVRAGAVAELGGVSDRAELLALAGRFRFEENAAPGGRGLGAVAFRVPYEAVDACAAELAAAGVALLSRH